VSETERAEIALGPGLPSVVLVRPKDQVALLDRAIARSSSELPDEGAPYYALVWPAAVPLARWLLGKREIAPGERVLELGCGLGLVGIALAKAGARVVLTDVSNEALELVRESVALNAPFAHEPRVARLDWGEPDISALGGPFPRVVGADVLYEPRSFPLLARAARAALAKGGTLYLAEPRRPVARSARDHLEREGLVLGETIDAGDGVLAQKWHEELKSP